MAQAKTRAPVEAKTQAAGLGGAIAGAVISILSVYAFHGTAVPAAMQSLIYTFTPLLLAGGAAWLAPHTPRPDLAPGPPAPLIFTGGGASGPPVGGGANTLSAASERLAPMPPAVPQAPPEATPGSSPS